MSGNAEKVRLLRQLSSDAPAPAREPAGRVRAVRHGFGWGMLGGVAALGALCGAGILFLYDGDGALSKQAQAPAADQPPRLAAPAAAAGSFTASGYIVARRVATVSSQVTGRLTEVLVEEGALVTRGQVLARLDSEIARVDIAGARAAHQAALSEIQAIQATLGEAERRNDRAEALRSRGFVSNADLDRSGAEVATLRASLDRVRARADVSRNDVAREATDLSRHEVRAPFSGVIVEKAAQPGEIVSPLSSGGFTRTGIYTIVDMDSLEVQVDVNEANIQRIRPGLPATVRIDAYPGLPIDGTVVAIIPTANRDRATIRVRVRLNTKDPRILPEMAARVTFAAAGTAGEI
jgi:RND family efflux transporter MFP subunit